MTARALCGCALALLVLGSASAGIAESVDTRTPIKHVIVIIGENRSFDHVFGLYRPKPGQTISNLLSKGILKADGTPGPNFERAAQFQAAPQTSYFISTLSKTPYVRLPPPQLGGLPTQQHDNFPPFRTIAEARAAEPALQPTDARLLTTGATGLPSARGPDTRVKNYDRLRNGPFLLTGPHLPYDSYTGDPIHRFYQMWQQSDCEPGNARRANPSGCRNDLYPFVSLTFSARYPGSGNAMGMYNVNAQDAPLLKKLADQFSSSDNFHQCFMGGTGGNHVMLATGDDVFFSDGKGKPAKPPQNLIANPNPRPGTNNNYIADGVWSNCSDPSQPGVGPISAYLRGLGLQTNCAPDHFYMLNNIGSGFLPNGSPRTGAPGTFVPPSEVRTIGASRMLSRCAAGGIDRQTRWHVGWTSRELQARPFRGDAEGRPGPPRGQSPARRQHRRVHYV